MYVVKDNGTQGSICQGVNFRSEFIMLPIADFVNVLVEMFFFLISSRLLSTSFALPNYTSAGVRLSRDS